MAASILLITGLVTLPAERTILPVGDNGHLLRTDPEFDQGILGRTRPFLSQHQIVVMTAAFVAVARNPQQGRGMILEPSRVSGKSL
jgi:hypothetical protein